MTNAKMDTIQVQDAVVTKKWTHAPDFILLAQGLVETAHGAGTGSGSHQFLSDASYFVRACPADKHFCQRFCDLWFIAAISLKHLCMQLPLPISGHRKILDPSCAGDEITLGIAIAVAFSVGRAFSPLRSYTLIKLFTHNFFNQHTYCTHCKGTQMLTKFLLFRHFFLG